jgi:hypothetical protein
VNEDKPDFSDADALCIPIMEIGEGRWRALGAMRERERGRRIALR